MLLTQALSLAHAGTLWHLGLDPDSETAMATAKAPEYMRPPVPRSWLVSDTDPDHLPGLDIGTSATAQLPSYHCTWDVPLHEICA